jgi:hypothetical protein
MNRDDPALSQVFQIRQFVKERFEEIREAMPYQERVTSAERVSEEVVSCYVLSIVELKRLHVEQRSTAI